MADLTADEIAKRFQDADAKAGFTPSASPAAPASAAPSGPLTADEIAKRFQDSDAATALAAKPPSTPEQDGGVASWPPLPSLGTVAGTVGSFAHGLSFGLDRPLDAATSWLFPNSSFAKMHAENQQSQTAFETAHPLLSTGAEIAGSIPTYAIGEGAARAAVPLATGGGASGAGLNILGSAARNAVVSGAQGAGMDESNPLAGGMRGAATGAVLGPIADMTGNLVSSLAGHGGAASVTPADAALGKLALDKYNIPITAPDLTSNQFLRTAEDQSGKMLFSGQVGADAAKRTAWRGALAGEMGEPGKTSFTPDVMDHAATRIGQAFDGVAAHTSIDPASATTMVGDLGNIMHTAQSTPLPEGTIKALQKQVDDIVDITAKGNGTISGQAYQALTRAKAPLDLAERDPNPNVAHFAGLIRDALDDAFVRSAAPADQQALTQAKYQYRLMRTIDPLVAGSRDGTFTPDAFMQKVVTASRRFDSPTGGIAYTGGGNVGELAKIGKLMRAAPDSGTAARVAVNSLALGAPAGGLTYLAANPAALASVPVTLGANRLVSQYLRSGYLARNLIDSKLNPLAASTSALSPLVLPPANALSRPSDRPN